MNAIAVQASRPLDAVETAAAVRRTNDELAEHRTIPPRVAAAVGRLTDRILAGDIDDWLAIEPYHALLVHRAILEAQETLGSPDDPDARDRLRLALERLALGLTLIAEAEPVGENRSAKQVAQWLVATVDVPQREIAELLGVDLRKLQRWVSHTTAMQPESDDARRVRTAARIVNQLRHSLSGPGVIAWFGWPRHDLGGETPADLLNDVSRTPELLLAAGSMRSTVLT
jgi:hypothetical protein